MPDRMTAREQAERELDASRTYQGEPQVVVARAVGVAGLRVGWGLCAVADAVERLAGAVEAVARPRVAVPPAEFDRVAETGGTDEGRGGVPGV